MIPLSQAITRGAPLVGGFTGTPYNDPLGAAYLGSLKPESVPHFWQFVRESTEEVLCKSMLHKLHMKWPHLGSTVRAWPRMAEELERDRLIPRVVSNQPTYRAEIHRSLFAVICDMHAAGESNGRVSEFLGRHGL